MRIIDIYLYEFKHFKSKPFKIIAVLLFALAGIYGLHNGADLYKSQIYEIENINNDVKLNLQKYTTYFDEEEPSPSDKPWIKLSSPYFAILSSHIYHFKEPSATMVFSIGQAEQYGYYKKVNFWASPYDIDMAEEIANPERLHKTTLDFAFVLLFLSPLLLLILLYNLNSAEREQGFLPLINVQVASKIKWIFTRALFYVSLVLLTCFVLVFYGAFLTNVFDAASESIFQMLALTLFYVLFWSIIFFLIIRNSKSIISNALQMIGIWFLVTFLIPSIVHQVLSIKKPTNTMTELIDAKRDETKAIFNQSTDATKQQLFALFPEIRKSKVASDSSKIGKAVYNTDVALVNKLLKESCSKIEIYNQEKNKFIRSSFWFNPLTLFYNWLNSISNTHYDDYQNYRSEVQIMIDQQVNMLVEDVWNDVKVDKKKFLAYQKEFEIKK